MVKNLVLQEPTPKRRSLMRGGFNVGDDLKLLLFMYSKVDDKPLSLSQLHIQTGISYAWVLLIIKKLHSLGLVFLRRDGRIVWCELSRDGRVVAQHLVDAKSFFVE